MVRNWSVVERVARAKLAEDPRNTRLPVALGEALLARGAWAEGFDLLARWADDPEARRLADVDYPYPRWRGETLSGRRFLVVSFGGLGDQIMFARFVPLLQAQGADVHWLCPPSMARLLHKCLGVRTIPAVGEVRLPAYDFFSTSWDLGALFFPPLTDLPNAPYLRWPAPTVIPGLTVGVVTHGNPKHDNDAHRSIPEEMRAELLSLPGAVSLKPEDTGSRDMHDTAQIVAGLDLVISVDTSVAHLAGAMGKPVWVLLPAEATDWRWMSDRTDSPWYPSARLFRQPTDGDWRPVIASVRAALARHRESAVAGERVDGVTAG